MLDDAGGKGDARHATDALCPKTGAIDENIAGDGAGIGDDANGAPAIQHNALDTHVLLDLHSSAASRLGIGHHQRIGIDITIAGDEGGSFYSFLGDKGEPRLRFA